MFLYLVFLIGVHRGITRRHQRGVCRRVRDLCGTPLGESLTQFRQDRAEFVELFEDGFQRQTRVVDRNSWRW